ncbi:hypothetical protein [Spirosoma rhododendri]|uniref:HEPN domain-containing protein n=1 Tax=Spirosoma rhododendri TaxID=2728024 RepID=A0A7L5DM02_9BACT|nr:hypothetical protein [Spirosoma rhododendri]QJD78552.1 hypothetical protein HH216_09040 [Spirosoma rhododendri]
MANRADFQQLATLRLTEAQTLLTHHLPDGAFYLAGYAVECALKSAICRTLGIDDFFEAYSSKPHGAKVRDDVVQKFKTHDYGTLLVLSGLYHKLSADLLIDKALNDSWSTFQNQNWSEQQRYATVSKAMSDAVDFVRSVTYFLQWISQHW